VAAIELDGDGFLDHRGHRVWWGSAGADTGRPPLLTVHGGPGICHDCLEPLAALADERRVVFFDSYGCGRSDRAADPQEYDVELFVDELQAVRDGLGLAECHLLAHSYGGPVALEYLLRRRPPGVRSLTLSNSFASVPALAAGWQRRLDQLPPEDAFALRNPVDVEPERYGAALGGFIGRFVYPSEPPDALVRSQMGSGAEVYERMHGSSWFTPDGQWSGWDAGPELGTLRLPALVVGGVRDQCVPELAEQLAAGIPGARLAVLDAAHLPFFEVPDEYLGTLRTFLAQADEAVLAERAPG
jgi:proline-specific peptidase